MLNDVVSPETGPVPSRLEVDARRVIFLLFLVLVGCEVLFVLGDWIFNVENLLGLGPVRSFWNIAREGGIASWFAITQTWMVGLTAALIYAVVRADGAATRRKVAWAIIALFLLYMSMDDGARFHERVGSSVRTVIQDPAVESGSRQIGFFPSYTWQLVFLPMFAAFGLFILWFLNKELKSVRDKLMVVAAIGLFVLAVTADFFEGLQPQHPLNLHSWISTTWQLEFEGVVHYSKSVEEFMEMLGMTFLWVTFLRHLVRIAPEIRLRFHNLPT